MTTDERAKMSARATALVEVVGPAATPDLSEDGGGRHDNI
jgi:hypothetical protein